MHNINGTILYYDYDIREKKNIDYTVRLYRYLNYVMLVKWGAIIAY